MSARQPDPTPQHHPDCPGDHAQLERQASRAELACETPEFDAIGGAAWGPGWRGRDAAGVTTPQPFRGHPQPRRLRLGDPLPAGWRWPTREEIKRDQRLGPVASMPIVITAPAIPWAIRADAWLWRTRAASEKKADR